MAAPQPLNLSHHFSYVSKNRLPSTTKSLYKYAEIPGIANLSGGLPHFTYFPHDTLEATVARPHRLNAGDLKSDRLFIPMHSDPIDPKQRIDLSTALQYGLADGYPALRSFMRQFVRDHLHPNVPYDGGPEVIMTCGNTDGLSKSIELLTNIWNPDRDWVHQREGVLVEEFTYMNAIQQITPRGLNIVGVAVDGQGMLAFGKGGLADVLENWDFKKGRRPHILYTIAIGQNPTGGVLSIERKKEIYALCQKFDVIIVEDEPYWNLQYPSAYELEASYRGSSPQGSSSYRQNFNSNGKSSGFPFLDSLTPSYLSIDTEGRVVRLDTFSKTIAPGSRLGWITAQPAIIERITRITETSTQQPSGFAQVMIAKTLMGNQTADESKLINKEDFKGWRVDGWVGWLEGLRGGYEKRMQVMCTALEENKSIILEQLEMTGAVDDWEMVDRVQMFDFVWPKAGMFIWLEVHFETHPLRLKYSAEELSKAFWVHLTKEPHKCLISPGSMFGATPKSAALSHNYFRLSFAPMDPNEVESLTRRLLDGFRSFWQLKELEDDEVLEVQAVTLQRSANFLGPGC
ncbi:hypothetical protein N7495_001133 [Penicillium taxi]|uniref:uncharacterized protein n=1 Tax=Penicillium taxi TaxID=168475 RepID=UPI00254505B4|nr:uncharacterized protein N7495_001133 [Penicillium taxi]KAJ5908451.1 hypothetical protein N7495_001133 [Penicillium taxi]